MKAGIIIDKWKLPIFTRHLREAGFSYDTAPGLTNDTHTLTVTCESAKQLMPTIQAAQNECATTQKGGTA